jgi:GNAT superfamily N-acetyltransferase
MTPGDRPYVACTWASGARYGKLKRRERFQLVDRVLDAGAYVIVLARENTVHAWACGEDDTLHYVYVPPELRGYGLARQVITHLFGNYPEHVNVTHPWPRESTRFRHTPELLLRTAA